MRPAMQPVYGLVPLLLLSLSGCQKLDVERSMSLSFGDVRSITVDAPRSEQKVAVAVTVSGSPVDVYVVLQSDHDATMDSLVKGKKLDAGKVLASAEKTEGTTLETRVPAKTEYAILVAGAKKQTEVKLKITGR